MTARSADLLLAPCVMFLVPASYADLSRKGVAASIADRDEGGFLARCITIHPFAPDDLQIDLNPRHKIYEIANPFPSQPSLPRFINWLRFLASLILTVHRIRRLARIENVDAIRAQDPFLTALLGLLCSRLPRRPFAISVHADYDKRFELTPAAVSTLFGSRTLARKIEGWLLRRADMVFPIRESLALKMLERNVCEQQVFVFPHGVDFRPFEQESRLDVRERLGIPRDKKILSFVGRLSNENYVDDILELAHRLSHRSDCVIVIAGGGPEEARIRGRIASDPQLSRLIQVHGFQPQEVVAALRQQSVLGLCLMAGFSLIETCAASRPAVSYDVEWHYELVRTGETGFLVPEGDLNALTAAVTQLLEDGRLADRLGRAAHALARSRNELETARDIRRTAYARLLRLESK